MAKKRRNKKPKSGVGDRAPWPVLRAQMKHWSKVQQHNDSLGGHASGATGPGESSYRQG